MEFAHIHTSSRFSRSAASLEAAIDNYRTQSSLITATEVSGGTRRKTLAEAGWGVHQRTGGDGASENAQMWDLDVWAQLSNEQIKLVGRWPTASGGTLFSIRANGMILRNKKSGHTLYTTTTHMPVGVAGPTGFLGRGVKRAERIAAYKTATSTWGKHIRKTITQKKPDLLLVTADWNINLAKKWAQEYTTKTIGAGTKVSFKQFNQTPTLGRSFYDCSLYAGMSTPGTRTIKDFGDASDHNPVRTVYTTLSKPGVPLKPGEYADSDDPDNNAGNSGYGTPWWNFDDYDDPEIYNIPEVD